ncbi:hypothetical protein [Nonomuraea sp. K271]|uniref:hypothetical protein n=1 Tax=Nonomuraea sp. K271 TaxID=1848319 RepID=UPI001487046C|nr:MULTISPECIES: hypothetical protein [unclassified Nonomuraea]
METTAAVTAPGECSPRKIQVLRWNRTLTLDCRWKAVPSTTQVLCRPDAEACQEHSRTSNISGMW